MEGFAAWLHSSRTEHVKKWDTVLPSPLYKTWDVAAACPPDLIIVGEFSELKGPVPLLTIPSIVTQKVYITNGCSCKPDHDRRAKSSTTCKSKPGDQSPNSFHTSCSSNLFESKSCCGNQDCPKASTELKRVHCHPSSSNVCNDGKINTGMLCSAHEKVGSCNQACLLDDKFCESSEQKAQSEDKSFCASKSVSVSCPKCCLTNSSVTSQTTSSKCKPFDQSQLEQDHKDFIQVSNANLDQVCINSNTTTSLSDPCHCHCDSHLIPNEGLCSMHLNNQCQGGNVVQSVENSNPCTCCTSNSASNPSSTTVTQTTNLHYESNTTATSVHASSLWCNSTEEKPCNSTSTTTVISCEDPYYHGINLNNLVLRLMSTDYQSFGGLFSIPSDSEVIELDLLGQFAGLSAVMRYITLHDLEARGFVRPICVAYITWDAMKINQSLSLIRDRLHLASAYLKSSNLSWFGWETLQKLSDLRFTKQSYIEALRRLPQHAGLDNLGGCDSSNIKQDDNGSCSQTKNLEKRIEKVNDVQCCNEEVIFSTVESDYLEVNKVQKSNELAADVTLIATSLSNNTQCPSLGNLPDVCSNLPDTDLNKHRGELADAFHAPNISKSKDVNLLQKLGINIVGTNSKNIPATVKTQTGNMTLEDCERSSVTVSDGLQEDISVLHCCESLKKDMDLLAQTSLSTIATQLLDCERMVAIIKEQLANSTEILELQQLSDLVLNSDNSPLFNVMEKLDILDQTYTAIPYPEYCPSVFREPQDLSTNECFSNLKLEDNRKNPFDKRCSSLGQEYKGKPEKESAFCQGQNRAGCVQDTASKPRGPKLLNVKDNNNDNTRRLLDPKLHFPPSGRRRFKSLRCLRQLSGPGFVAFVYELVKLYEAAKKSSLALSFEELDNECYEHDPGTLFVGNIPVVNVLTCRKKVHTVKAKTAADVTRNRFLSSEIGVPNTVYSNRTNIGVTYYEPHGLQSSNRNNDCRTFPMASSSTHYSLGNPTKGSSNNSDSKTNAKDTKPKFNKKICFNVDLVHHIESLWTEEMMSACDTTDGGWVVVNSIASIQGTSDACCEGAVSEGCQHEPASEQTCNRQTSVAEEYADSSIPAPSVSVCTGECRRPDGASSSSSSPQAMPGLLMQSTSSSNVRLMQSLSTGGGSCSSNSTFSGSSCEGGITSSHSAAVVGGRGGAEVEDDVALITSCDEGIEASSIVTHGIRDGKTLPNSRDGAHAFIVNDCHVVSNSSTLQEEDLSDDESPPLRTEPGGAGPAIERNLSSTKRFLNQFTKLGNVASSYSIPNSNEGASVARREENWTYQRRKTKKYRMHPRVDIEKRVINAYGEHAEWSGGGDASSEGDPYPNPPWRGSLPRLASGGLGIYKKGHWITVSQSGHRLSAALLAVGPPAVSCSLVAGLLCGRRLVVAGCSDRQSAVQSAVLALASVLLPVAQDNARHITKYHRGILTPHHLRLESLIGLCIPERLKLHDLMDPHTMSRISVVNLSTGHVSGVAYCGKFIRGIDEFTRHFDARQQAQHSLPPDMGRLHLSSATHEGVDDITEGHGEPFSFRSLSGDGDSRRKAAASRDCFSDLGRRCSTGEGFGAGDRKTSVSRSASTPNVSLKRPSFVNHESLEEEDVEENMFCFNPSSRFGSSTASMYENSSEAENSLSASSASASSSVRPKKHVNQSSTAPPISPVPPLSSPFIGYCSDSSKVSASDALVKGKTSCPLNPRRMPPNMDAPLQCVLQSVLVRLGLQIFLYFHVCGNCKMPPNRLMTTLNVEERNDMQILQYLTSIVSRQLDLADIEVEYLP